MKTECFCKIALTIAGSDPSGGAGIQADLKTFHAHAVFGMSVITAVTVQNSCKVFDVQPLSPHIVHDQILRLFEDAEIDSIKIGMTANASIIESIASALKKIKLPPVVLDPVMVSTSGYSLLNEDARQNMIQHLFPLTTLVTPNLEEATFLTGIPVMDLDSMRKAAEHLGKSFHIPYVVVKGGHLEGNPVDVFFDGVHVQILEGTRINTPHTHGTGCTFASAIAANLARGNSVSEAVIQAKRYLTGALEHSFSFGKGHGSPHHFFKVYPSDTAV